MHLACAPQVILICGATSLRHLMWMCCAPQPLGATARAQRAPASIYLLAFLLIIFIRSYSQAATCRCRAVPGGRCCGCGSRACTDAKTLKALPECQGTPPVRIGRVREPLEGYRSRADAALHAALTSASSSDCGSCVAAAPAVCLATASSTPPRCNRTWKLLSTPAAWVRQW